MESKGMKRKYVYFNDLKGVELSNFAGGDIDLCFKHPTKYVWVIVETKFRGLGSDETNLGKALVNSLSKPAIYVVVGLYDYEFSDGEITGFESTHNAFGMLKTSKLKKDSFYSNDEQLLDLAKCVDTFEGLLKIIDTNYN